MWQNFAVYETTVEATEIVLREDILRPSSVAAKQGKHAAIAQAVFVQAFP